ncbi:MAG: mandelate racemase [Proteobacteria bacterium]|nr:mandelate racemase [Pseudomonadota bacterium]
MPITIAGFRARPVATPIKYPPRPASGSIDTASLVLIDIETNEGITGHTYLFTFSKSMLKPTVDCFNAVCELIVGDTVSPLDIEGKLRRQFTLYDAHGILGQVLAGIDMAVWDIFAKSLELPLAAALGGSPTSIQAYNSCGLWTNETADTLPKQAQELIRSGDYKAVKMRIGRPDFNLDLAAIRAVKKEIGDDIGLMADINQSLSLNEAIKRCQALDYEGLYWIEDPIRHDDYEGCAKVRVSIDTPIQIGENLLNSLEMKKAIDAEAGDFYMPDVQRIGGVTGWLRAAALAQVNALDLSSHLFPEISCHLLSISPTRHWLEYVDWGASVMQEPIKIVNGMAITPDRPGIGISWDEKVVKQYLVP